MEPQVLIWRAAAGVLLLTTLLLAWPAVHRLREPPPPPPSSLRLSLSVPPGVTAGAGDAPLDASISPDERAIIFVATADGTPRLWLRRLDTERAAPLAGTDGASLPAWRPDGSAITFFAANRLRTLTLTDGEVRDVADAPAPGGAVWLEDGSIVFGGAGNQALKRVRDGQVSDASTLAAGDVAHLSPSRAGGGLLYVALRQDGRRIVRVVTGGETHDLGTTEGHAQMAGPFLLHVRDGALLAQAFDLKTGTLGGRAVPVALEAGTWNGRGLFTASPRLLVVTAGGARSRELRWFGTDGQPAGAASDRGDYWQVRLSPDDATAAVTMLEPQLRTLDIFLVPMRPGPATRGLTLALAADSDPVWSPDGRRVLFRSLQDGQPNLFSRDAFSQGAPIEPALRSTGDEAPTDWRRVPGGGSEVMYHAAGPRGDTDLMLLDTGTGASRQAIGSTFNQTDGRWSPDGRWLAYVSDDFGQPDVFVQAWPSGERVRVTQSGAVKPRWSPDGRTLYVLRGAEIAGATRPDGTSPRFSPPQTMVTLPGIRDFDVAHRSNRILAIVPAPGTRRDDIRAIVDWQTIAAQPNPPTPAQ